GHPLMEVEHIAGGGAEWRIGQGLDPDAPLLALFPGSRAQEVERHLPLFAQTAALLRERIPGLQAMIAAVEGIPDATYNAAALPITRQTSELLSHATGALVKSGTTTLEAALAETPFVVA